LEVEATQTRDIPLLRPRQKRRWENELKTNIAKFYERFISLFHKRNNRQKNSERRRKGKKRLEIAYRKGETDMSEQ